MGWHEWDDEPLRQEVRSQVKTHLGQGDGVLVFDPSGFPKSGSESVGVARQWCGRLGKVDNCQVAMYLGYVSCKGHTLVDTPLYLPKEWTKDKACLDKAGVPKGARGYRTRHQLALEMLAKNGADLPHSWIAGDDELGRSYWFRRQLAALGERYVLAVPSNTTICDLEVESPEYSGRGRRSKRPWLSVEAWSQSLADETWLRIDVRDGSQGPPGGARAHHAPMKKNDAGLPTGQPEGLQGLARAEGPLSVQEIRRLFWRLVLATQHRVERILAWYVWRRWHQGDAKYWHYKRRAVP